MPTLTSQEIGHMTKFSMADYTIICFYSSLSAGFDS